jgi:glycosyltransferase involved in cell wall biosynthesis
LRILHIVTVFERGGAQSVVIELARLQLAAGHEVGVMAGSGGAAWDDLPAGVKRFPEPSFRKSVAILADVAGFFAIRATIAAFKPDILHLHSSKAGTLGRLAGFGMRKRIVYTVHGFDTIRLGHRAFLPIERALAGACGAVIAVSEYDRANLEECGIRGSRIVLNGIRDFSGDPPHPRRDIVAMFEADRAAGRVVVMTMARLAVPKRFDLFSETAAAMSDEGYSFYWFGNREAVSATLPGNLHVMGDLPDARLLLRDADIFCLLSDYEGLPMSVLEALCAGKPVVASAIGGISEAVGTGCAVLVPNETKAVAAAIRKSASDRTRLGAAGRALYLERYGVECMAAAYGSIYRELGDTSGMRPT